MRCTLVLFLLGLVLVSGCIGQINESKETKIIDESLLISPGAENMIGYELPERGAYRYEFSSDKPINIWVYPSLAEFKLGRLQQNPNVYSDCSILFRLAGSGECIVDAGARLGMMRIEVPKENDIGNARVSIRIFKK